MRLLSSGYTWSNKGHRGYAVETLSNKGTRVVVKYVSTKEEAVLAVKQLGDK